MEIKQQIIKVALRHQTNDKILVLGKQVLRELELKLQVGAIQDKLNLIELKKNSDEVFVDMSHFNHKGWPLLLVLGSKNSLRVFSEDKLMKKLNLDFDVLNYSILDIAKADSSYNQIVFGFNMMNEKEQKIYREEMYSPRNSQQSVNEQLSQAKPERESQIQTKETSRKTRAMQLICVKDNFLILTNDMRFCFCKLDKFERKWDSIYNPLSILFPSNYQVKAPRSGTLLFSMSVNNRLSMLTFNLLIPVVEDDKHTEQVVSHAWATETVNANQMSRKGAKSRFFRHLDKTQSKPRKSCQGAKESKKVDFRFKAYVLNILQLDTEELPLKPLHPVESTSTNVNDISTGRSKNVVCYIDESSIMRLFSVNGLNEYKTALKHHSE